MTKSLLGISPVIIDKGQLPPNEVLEQVHRDLNRLCTKQHPSENEPIPYELTVLAVYNQPYLGDCDGEP